MTTKDLLTTIKKFLLDKSREGLSENLAKVKQFKKGVLSPIPIFPAVVIVPLSERLERFYSGGMYYAGREVEIYVYIKGIGKQKEDSIQCLKTIEEIGNLFYENHTLGKSEIYNLEFGEEDYGQTSFGRLILQEGKFTATFWSKESLPNDRINNISLSTSDVKDLLDSITDKFKEYEDNGSLDIRQIESVALPPIARFPSVGIIELPSRIEHEEAGRDTHFRNFSVFIWSKLFDKEIALDANLDLIEQVKNLIWKNYKWEGQTRNTTIGTINYQMLQESMLYQSQVNFECEAVSLVPTL